jgi:WD40 repeat protein
MRDSRVSIPRRGTIATGRFAAASWRASPSQDYERAGEDHRDFAWHYLHRLARRELVRLPERDAEMHILSASRDWRTIASQHMDSSVVLWDLPSERLRFRIAEPGCGYWHPCLTSDGRVLVDSEEDRPRVELDGVDAVAFASDGRLFATRAGGRLTAFAPDGSSLASCSHDGEINVWRTRERP